MAYHPKNVCLVCVTASPRITKHLPKGLRFLIATDHNTESHVFVSYKNTETKNIIKHRTVTILLRLLYKFIAIFWYSFFSSQM